MLCVGSIGCQNQSQPQPVNDTIAKKTSEKDKKTNEDKVKLEKADEPTDVMGMYLACADIDASKSKYNGKYVFVGCRMQDEQGKKVATKNIGPSQRWSVRVPKGSALKGKILQEKEESFWHTITVFAAGSNLATTTKHVNVSTFALTVTQEKTALSLLADAPPAQTYTTQPGQRDAQINPDAQNFQQTTGENPKEVTDQGFANDLTQPDPNLNDLYSFPEQSTMAQNDSYYPDDIPTNEFDESSDEYSDESGEYADEYGDENSEEYADEYGDEYADESDLAYEDYSDYGDGGDYGDYGDYGDSGGYGDYGLR